VRAQGTDEKLQPVPWIRIGRWISR